MCCSIYVCRVTERETKIATGKRSHSDFYFVLSCMPMECRFTRKHYCFWVLIHVAFVGVLESCLEEERLGLLSIKDHFKLYSGDANEFLPSWTDDPVADCCSWERVKCNNATMVTQLSLGRLLPSFMGQGLNMSLFTPFKELLNLDLSLNGFNDCYQTYDFKALKNLVSLDLSYNVFNSIIQPCLSPLTSLQSLHLEQSVNYDANLPIPDFKALKNLVILGLSGNNFNGTISDFKVLKNLVTLDLSYNNFNGTISSLCELKSLQELALEFNNLSGTIPPCLGNLTSLRILDLSFNRLEGNISSSPIFNLKDLKYIDLRDNFFEGIFSFYSIANFTNLKGLMLSNLEVQTQYSQNWLPTFQLKGLWMSNCKLDNIPQFFAHQTELIAVDLSHNNLTKTFPNWLLENNMKLGFLNLRNNSFFGQFHLSSNSSFVTSSIDISDNYFHGELQPDIGDLFPKAVALNLSGNAFDGHIPFSIGHMPELSCLDLSINNFSGEIATTLVGLANFSNLVVLAAAKTRLHGRIPNSINMTSLRVLQLSGNRITGDLSSWISHYLNLHFLDISDNHITGEIPPSIGKLSSSYSRITLNMAHNELEGRIPSELARLELFYLDLSDNFLSGPIPCCFNSSSLLHFNLEGNRLTGSISETLFNSSAIQILNIGNNLLSGCIPSSVGALSNIRILLLHQNSLRGLIPNQLCRLNKLNILDLSHNLFSGPIPHCFGNISFGKLTLSNFAYQSKDVNAWGFGPIIASNLFHNFLSPFAVESIYGQLVQVGFVTKTMSNIYKGSILDLMTGLDLSCNQLTGKIPAEFGNLSYIHALNLSHNQLTGFIPATFAKLKEIESLDLSHNKLSGEIPSELMGLHFLSSFSVAYNNLSGRLPDMDRQFQTFDNKSYEGNPFLCGPPLTRNCSVIDDIPQVASSDTDASEEKWYDIDPVSFTASFMASYLVFLVAFATILYINPGWRRRLFMFIENLIDECYLLVFYTVPKLFAALYR